MRETSLPIVEDDDLHGERRSHPSYAKINVSRVSGHTELFDSAFEHQHFIHLSISRAEVLGHPASHQFIYGKEELIEVAMSETQFARMISSLNIGSGTPCTLQRWNGESVIQPANESHQKCHTATIGDKLQGAVDNQKKVLSKLQGWRESKHRPTLKEMDELIQGMESQVENFNSNMKYYARCFEEHMEKTVDEARTEIEAHMIATADKLGLTRNPCREIQDGTITPQLGFVGE